MQASPPSEAAIRDSSRTRWRSPSARNSRASRSAASSSSAPPAIGEQQAARSPRQEREGRCRHGNCILPIPIDKSRCIENTSMHRAIVNRRTARDERTACRGDRGRPAGAGRRGAPAGAGPGAAGAGGRGRPGVGGARSGGTSGCSRPGRSWSTRQRARLLEPSGWAAPERGYPTGAEWIARYLAPLAEALGGRVRSGARVTGRVAQGPGPAGRRRPRRPAVHRARHRPRRRRGAAGGAGGDRRVRHLAAAEPGRARTGCPPSASGRRPA